MQISDLAEFLRDLDDPSVATHHRGAARDARLDGPHRSRLPQPRPRVGHPVRRGGAAHQDGPPPRLRPDRCDLRLRRADGRPPSARRAADERPAAAAARQGQHRPRGGARAGGDPRSPTTSSTWVPAPARTAARSCTRGRSPGCSAAGTLTGQHLDVEQALKADVRAADAASIPIRNATLHNLQDVSVDVPLGRAGGGHRASPDPARARSSTAACRAAIPSVTVIDQAAIRGSRRSNPATYTGILEPIRKAFATANKREAGALQRQLGGRLPGVQGAGPDLHRSRLHGRRRIGLRGVRGPPLHR